MNITFNNLMRFLIRIRQPAHIFVAVDPFVHKGKGMMMCIAFLNGHIFNIKRPFIYAGWRASLKAHQLNAIIQ